MFSIFFLQKDRKESSIILDRYKVSILKTAARITILATLLQFTLGIMFVFNQGILIDFHDDH